MGVAGSGKSTVAAALADSLGLEPIEGDALHPAANVEKMRHGIALTDEDRQPWLASLAGLLADRHARGRGTVLACSALRRAYRDVLRAAVPAGETFIVELAADAATLRARMIHRPGHFMAVDLLDSQLATLEHIGDDEVGVVVDAAAPLDVVVSEAAAAIDAWIASKR
ncbi:MAG TPA: gluconokinase [Candidatus Limnocylindrales bacterium]|nr:gluconokinase [Candidatus Limnocylindrales bacterium]